MTADQPKKSPRKTSLDFWRTREIEPRDHTLGELFSTTTRVLMSAETGIGKTHLAMAWGMAQASGTSFCHWNGSGRERRVMMIDGEMPRDLAQERLREAEERTGCRDFPFFYLNWEDFPDMPPLDTQEGMDWVGWQIADHGGIDQIVLDNMATLTQGDLTTAEGWAPMIPFAKSLTKERIGQLYVNHAGLAKTRDFGTTTRLWQMDIGIVLTKLENHPGDVAFCLDFTKNRLKTPSNRSDFEPVKMFLENNLWSTEPVDQKIKLNGKSPPPGYNRAIEVLHNLLIDAEPVKPTPNHTRIRAVRREILRNKLVDIGILTLNDKKQIDAGSRTILRRIITHGTDCNALREDSGWIWCL